MLSLGRKYENPVECNSRSGVLEISHPLQNSENCRVLPKKGGFSLTENCSRSTKVPVPSKKKTQFAINGLWYSTNRTVFPQVSYLVHVCYFLFQLL